MEKKKVLFVCVRNSSRSQISEAYLKKYGGEHFDARSAGLEPSVLNPLVVEAMKEDGIDISQNKAKSVFDLFKNGEIFHYIVTVCDAKAAQKCPIFPGVIKVINWSFEDPSQFQGSKEEKLQKIRELRERIKEAIRRFVNEHT